MEHRRPISTAIEKARSKVSHILGPRSSSDDGAVDGPGDQPDTPAPQAKSGSRIRSLIPSGRTLRRNPFSRKGKKNTALFIDVYEHIMDMLGEQHDCASLAACALVSRDWLPRARLNLYRHVRLVDGENLEQFLSTIRAHPTYAQYTEDLEIAPHPSQEEYIGFMLLSPHVRTLSGLLLGPNVKWKEYPPRYHALGRHAFSAVTRLTLSVQFPTIADLYRVVWSFLNITKCSINADNPVAAKPTEPPRTALTEESSQTRSKPPCSKLSELAIPVSVRELR